MALLSSEVGRRTCRENHDDDDHATSGDDPCKAVGTRVHVRVAPDSEDGVCDAVRSELRKGGRALPASIGVLARVKSLSQILDKTVRGLLRPSWREASKGDAFGGNVTRVCFMRGVTVRFFGGCEAQPLRLGNFHC